MKKEYMKPTVKVVELQHRTMILAGSGGGPLGSVNTQGVDDGDELFIEDTPAGTDFWGR